MVATGVLTLFAQQQIVLPSAQPPGLRLLTPRTVENAGVAASLTSSSDQQTDSTRFGADARAHTESSSEGPGRDQRRQRHPSGPAGDPERFEIRLILQDDPVEGLRVLDVRLVATDPAPRAAEPGDLAANRDVTVRVGIDPDRK